MPLDSDAHFAAEDLLSQVVLERVRAGAATRRHARVAEPVGARVDPGVGNNSAHSEYDHSTSRVWVDVLPASSYRRLRGDGARWPPRQHVRKPGAPAGHVIGGCTCWGHHAAARDSLAELSLVLAPGAVDSARWRPTEDEEVDVVAPEAWRP